MGKNIAIITARGGSKRIPKKNIRDFFGKPIIAYSIEAALTSGIFDEVMVSTDSEEIADISRRYGASVPFMRSERTSNDFATTADAVMEVIEEYKKNGAEFDIICCIYPTAPFITADKLKEGMKLMEDKDIIEVIPVVQFSYPPQRCYIIENDGKIRHKYPEYETVRSQDLEKQYHDAGQFYIFRTEEFVKCDGVIRDGIYPIIVSETEVQDIDNEEDWRYAEVKYNYMIHNRDKIKKAGDING